MKFNGIWQSIEFSPRPADDDAIFLRLSQTGNIFSSFVKLFSNLHFL